MAVPFFPIDEAYLIGGWLESFFWGLYTLLFGMTLYGILKKRRLGVNAITTGSIIILYILATAHMSLALVRLVQGFILYRNTIGPILYFANISVRLNMAKDYIYITNLAVGDAVIAWRLYVVWGKNIWIAILPILAILGEFITGYGSISQWFFPHPNAHVIAHWGNGMFIISLAANIIITATIVGRIWYMTSRTRQALETDSHSQYSRVILLLVESGALIAAAKLTEFTLFKNAPLDGLNGLNALYIVYEVMPQITGIAPTVIVYAVNNGYTRGDDCYTATGARSTLVFNTTRTTDMSSDPVSIGSSSFTETEKKPDAGSSSAALDAPERKVQIAWRTPTASPFFGASSPDSSPV